MVGKMSATLVMVGILVLVSSFSAFAVTEISFITRAWDGAFEEIVEKFNLEFQGRIHVDAEIVASGGQIIDRAILQTLAGNPPDVIYQTFTGDLIANELIVDVTRFVNSDPALRDDFVPAMLDVFKYGGRYFGIPMGAYGAWAVVYNRVRLAESGLSEPAETWTWSDFIETARRLTHDTSGDGTPDLWGVANNQPNAWHDGWLLQNDSTYYDWDNNTWFPHTDRAVEALTFQRSWFAEYGFATRSRSEFLNGNAGMLISQQDTLASLKSLDLGAVNLPANRSREIGVKSWGLYMGNTGDPARMEASWEFMKFAVGALSQMRFTKTSGYLSGRTSVLSDPTYADFVRQEGLGLGIDVWIPEVARYGRGYPFAPGRSAFWSLTSRLTQRVENMEMSPLELIEQVRQESNQHSAEVAAKIAEVLGR